MAKCGSCGADAAGMICGYCGASVAEVSGAKQELEAVAAFYRAVQDAPDDARRADMLAFGYVPQSTDALLEAAVRCLPALDPDTGAGDDLEARFAVTKAGWKRLEVILLRLKMAPQDDRTRTLIEELEQRIATMREDERRANRSASIFVIGFFGVIIAGLVAVVYLIAS